MHPCVQLLREDIGHGAGDSTLRRPEVESYEQQQVRRKQHGQNDAQQVFEGSQGSVGMCQGLSSWR